MADGILGGFDPFAGSPVGALIQLGYEPNVAVQIASKPDLAQGIIANGLIPEQTYGLLSDYQINTHAPGTLGATDPTAFTDPTTRAALNELGDRGLYADDFTSRDEVLQELYHPGSIVNDEPPAPEYDPNAPDLAAEEFARAMGPEWQALKDEAMGNVKKWRGERDEMTGDWAAGLRGNEALADLRGDVGEYRNVYERGGLTDVTRANLERARREEDQWIRAQREAMLQDLAERGMTGGGAEILGAIGDRAAAADRMSARDLDTLGMAQEQAMQALAAAGEGSRNLYGIEKDIADVERDVALAGADQEFSIADTIGATERDTWINGIMLPKIEEGARMRKMQAEGVFPAASEAAGILGKGASESRGNVAGTITTDTAAEGANEGAYLQGAAMTGPTLDTTQPAVIPNSGAAGGQAGEQTINSVIDATTALVDNFSRHDDDQKSGKAGRK